MANYDYGKGLTGLSFYGPNPDPGGLINGGVANVFPEISQSGHVIILKATVALLVGDALIFDASNSKQVTKSTAGGTFAGFCIGRYRFHQADFTSGPAAGEFALVQITGVAPAIVGSAVVVAGLVTFSSTVAGRVVPLAGAANTTAIGATVVSQSTVAGLSATLITAGRGSATSGTGSSFAPTLIQGATVSYVAPTGATFLRVTMYGGSGGGGSGIATPHNGGAGAVGGFIRALVKVGSNSPFTVAIGAAGAAAGANPADGGNGGATTFADAAAVNTLSAGGGGGGVHATAGGDGAAGAAPSNTAVSDQVVVPSVDINSTTVGMKGGAGGVAAGAAVAGLAGFIIVEPF